MKGQRRRRRRRRRTTSSLHNSKIAGPPTPFPHKLLLGAKPLQEDEEEQDEKEEEGEQEEQDEGLRRRLKVSPRADASWREATSPSARSRSVGC